VTYPTAARTRRWPASWFSLAVLPVQGVGVEPGVGEHRDVCDVANNADPQRWWMQGTGVDDLAVLLDDDQTGTSSAYRDRGVGRHWLGAEARPR
jgi:hypothetical protein